MSEVNLMLGKEIFLFSLNKNKTSGCSCPKVVTIGEKSKLEDCPEWTSPLEIKTIFL